MLDDIGSKAHAKEWLDKRLNSKQVVWGMGHREYSTKDPRAKILNLENILEQKNVKTVEDLSIMRSDLFLYDYVILPG